MTKKIVWVVMVQKQNGSIVNPMVFESQFEAILEQQAWQKEENVLDAWVVGCHLNKKQKAAA
jgi:hypothetical protein